MSLLSHLALGIRSLMFDATVPSEAHDAIVVLGASVRPDGSPSPALRRRVEAAARLFHAGLAPRLVISGGVVTYPPSEAQVGAELACALGVPQSAIVQETRARNTEGNAAHCLELIGHSAVIVVTDDFHVARSHLLFRRHFDQVCMVSCRSPHRWRHAPRELLATLWAALRAPR